MRILILGAGAIGSLLGARLSRTNALLILLGRNRQHMDSIRREALIVEELDGSRSRYVLPHCYSDPREIEEKADLVLVAVKTYDTQTAVSSIEERCDENTVFLTIQNGIGNWERLAGLVGEERALVGTTAQGATLVKPGTIRHGGNGPTFIGEVRQPPTERVRRVVELFQSAGLEIHPSGQMKQLIWEKLLVNVGINAITGLTGVLNGIIAEVEAARELSKCAVEEASLVAAAKGIQVPPDIVLRVLSVAQRTAVNRSSMGQDVDRKRRTEIDAINGAIVALGQELGIPTPVNATLTQLIKIVETTYPKRN